MTKTKNKSLFYLIWAIIFSLSPMLVSFFDLIGLKFNSIMFMFFSFFVFVFLFLIRFVLNLKNDYNSTITGMKNTFSSIAKKPISILFVLCFVFVFISSFVNGFNSNTIIFLSYFIVVLCLFKLDRSKQNLIIHILIITTAICCIMGFIDPIGKIMPGFESFQINLSLQFYNPNHSAYVIATMLILSVGLLQKSKSLIFEVLYGLISLIYTIFLFMNGSFASITFAFVSLILMMIFFICRYKKFPIKTTVTIISMVVIGLLVEFVPNVNSVRTIGYNYFIELIEVVNHYFKTNIPIPKMWGATKEYLSSNSTSNLYTFVDRQNLIVISKETMSNNPKSILFGFGAGTYLDLTPHNIFVALMLDFGIVVPLCLYAIFALSIINFLRNKHSHSTYFILFALICFILCGFTGSLMAYSGIYLFIILGLCLKESISQD